MVKTLRQQFQQYTATHGQPKQSKILSFSFSLIISILNKIVEIL